MLTLLSCTQTEKKKTQNIEIYLTKNRIESYQGIELENSNTDTLKIRALQNRWGKNQIRLDTIKSELILAGAFKANKTDLENEPFIKADQIMAFDKSNGKLILDSIATLKLSQLKSDSFGRQFVLTLNGRPEMFGYFYPSAFSFGCNTYHYPYLTNSKIKELELHYGLELRNVEIKQEFPNLFEAIIK
jgi:hypothetical protein|tara:strand:- start:46 stop:609 length:564 start_codon:yes stop_codon:yes gene_type:complete